MNLKIEGLDGTMLTLRDEPRDEPKNSGNIQYDTYLRVDISHISSTHGLNIFLLSGAIITVNNFENISKVIKAHDAYLMETGGQWALSRDEVAPPNRIVFDDIKEGDVTYPTVIKQDCTLCEATGTTNVGKKCGRCNGTGKANKVLE